jgi:hypothetical protein
VDRFYSAGVEEDPFCEGCLARVDVSAYPNVAHLRKTFCVCRRHVLNDFFLRSDVAGRLVGPGRFCGSRLPSYEAGADVGRWPSRDGSGGPDERPEEAELADSVARGGAGEGGNCAS